MFKHYARVEALNLLLIHLEHKTPPYGLSGLLVVLDIFFILEGNALGVPFKTTPQVLHLAGEGFLRL